MTPITTIIRQNQGLNLLLDCLNCISNKDRAEQGLYKELWEIIDMYYGGKNNGENI